MSNKKGYQLKDGGAKIKTAEPSAEQPAYKTEETLKQEARARLEEQERLKAAQPPESERKKKYDNFMYHYKWHTIAGAFGAVLLIFLLRDTLFRTQPDITLVVATSRYFAQTETDALQSALQKYAYDFNNDGKVVVQLDAIYLPTAAITAGGEENTDDNNLNNMLSGADPEMIQASQMKLMAITAAWTDPLYLVDDGIYNYLTLMSGSSDAEEAAGENAESADKAGANAGAGAGSAETGSDYSLFETLSGVPAAYGPRGDRLSVADTLLMSEPDCESLADLSFSLRPAPNSKQKSIDYQAFCAWLLQAIAAGQ